jgi:hypothetical protein
MTVLYWLYYGNGSNGEKIEKKGGKKKEMMITVEVKSNSKRLWRSRLRRKHPSLQKRLDRRQKQVSLDRLLVKVAQQEKESTDSSDSVIDNESRPTQ